MTGVANSKNNVEGSRGLRLKQHPHLHLENATLDARKTEIDTFSLY
jgi:hypothetical protein